MKNFFKAICFGLIKKYSAEQKTLTAEIEEIETKNEGYGNHAAERRHLYQEFLEAPELTREMYYELLNRVFVGGHPKIIDREREIDIIYKVHIASVLRHKLTKNDKMYDPTAHTLPDSAIKNRTFSISPRIFANLYFLKNSSIASAFNYTLPIALKIYGYNCAYKSTMSEFSS